jgi:hypothetical protein
MTHQTVKQNRERFKKRLEDTASKQAIPIDKLDMREVRNRNAFELIANSGGKERVFTIEDFAISNDPQAEIDQIINVLIDNE